MVTMIVVLVGAIVGLSLAALLRFVILKHPVAKTAADWWSGLVLIIALISCVLLAVTLTPDAPSNAMPWSAAWGALIAFFCSREILKYTRTL
jgi:hypothetical protein